MGDFARLVADPEIVENTRVPGNAPPGFAATRVGRYEEGRRDGSRAGFASVSRGASGWPERAGYRREGVRRSLHREGNRRADMPVHSLLPGDPR